MTSAAQCYVGIGSVPAAGSMNGGATKIWTGLIFGDGLHAATSFVPMNHKFNVNDIVLAQGPLGSLIHMWVAFDIESPISTQ
jgi:tetrahydromethanopterin S-methyltransferase subunit D